MKPKGHSGRGHVRTPPTPRIPLDHILFRGGDDLTTFQSVGLLLIGLAFVIFIGLPIFIYLCVRPDQRDLQGIVICAGMTLWGLVMMMNGLAAILRRKKQDRQHG